MNPCRNGGQCIKKSDDISINNFYCNCPVELTGYLCEFQISEQFNKNIINIIYCLLLKNQNFNL